MRILPIVSDAIEAELAQCVPCASWCHASSGVGHSSRSLIREVCIVEMVRPALPLPSLMLGLLLVLHVFCPSSWFPRSKSPSSVYLCWCWFCLFWYCCCARVTSSTSCIDSLALELARSGTGRHSTTRQSASSPFLSIEWKRRSLQHAKRRSDLCRRTHI